MFHKPLRGFMIAISFLTIVGSISSALAQDSGTPSATPSPPVSTAQVLMSIRADGQTDGQRLTAEIKPGETKDLKVFLGNYGADLLKVFTFTADISTKINGGLTMGKEGAEQHEPTSWAVYPTEYYDIEPQTEVERDFTVSVPDGTSPGEYVIPIAVETVDSFPVPGAGQIRQKIRKILAVYIDVPGDFTAGFDFGDPTVEFVTGGAAIQIPITNLGQSTLRLSGQLTVKDQSGNVVIDAPIVMAAFYGKNSTIVQWRLESLLPVGDYQLSLTLTDNISGVTNGFENRALTMPEAPSTETVPIAFGQILIAPNADPIQFASAVVEIINNADVYRSTKLTLIVTKDSQPLEEFVLAENVLLNQGTTTVSQRYLPLTGWESGSYGFSLRLESVDPGSGAVSLLLQSDNVATIDVP